MSALSRDDVLKLAKLSRLKLTDEEVGRFRKELSAILEYVKQLDSADTTGLEATYQVTGLKNVTRPDEEVDYGYKLEALLEQAPDVQDNQFRVKRIIG